jgi:putative ABC transport system permease protein
MSAPLTQAAQGGCAPGLRVCLAIEKGEAVAIMGPSDSGKPATGQAIATGRAARAWHGYAARRLLSRLTWTPGTFTIGLAAPSARPARTFLTLAAVVSGAAAR